MPNAGAHAVSEFLFPAIAPRRTGRLKVGGLHEIYWEESGNPQGKPVVMLHGGPGGGSNPAMHRFHDPDAHRVVVFDQRGCGRSTPHAELSDNTTWHLVSDIEALREHLGIEQWQVFGGSWGSALALAYAQSHPGRVSELVLRGIFTLRRAELQWFYQCGASWLFPDLFALFRDYIPEDERGDLIAAYHRRLTGSDAQVRLEAAKRWAQWEGATLSVKPDPARVEHFGEDDFALAFASIEAHYFVNGGFFERDDHLLRNVGRIRHIPGVIVQGRYDVVTPAQTAFELANAWPEAELKIIDVAGHTATEPGISEALVTATNSFKGRPA
ncbi:prolyl aminopeptidase [Rhizobiales bacterium]|uniref:prolyl aminopeptidase n=1 Tax=Hongsoonwoonella zoysiae TaxID=2821844 RepID=UPI00156099C2|nr:prolyl aminopeptidase [Hongsoonwoonella zoysiae]